MRIGVLSDTHIPTRARCLPPEIFTVFKNVELILHAGDLVDPLVLSELETLAPVQAVAGNMDPPGLQSCLAGKSWNWRVPHWPVVMATWAITTRRRRCATDLPAIMSTL